MERRTAYLGMLVVLCFVASFLIFGCTPRHSRANPYGVPDQRWKAPKEVIVSAWSPLPVVIDGQGAEWSAQSLKDFPELRFSLGVRNDANSIFVVLVTHAPNLVRALANDLTLWVDGAGKRRKRYGVGIPEDSGFGYQFWIKNQQWLESLDAEERRRIEAELQAEKRIVITRRGRSTIASKGKDSAAIAFGLHGGLFCFEFRIPRAWANGKTVGSHPTLGLELSIPIRGRAKDGIGKSSGVSVSGQRRGGQSMGGRGMGGRGMGSRGMGGSRKGGQGGRPQGQGGVRGTASGMVRLEKREIWVKVILAKNSTI